MTASLYQPDPADLAAISASLETASPQHVLEWAAGQFGERLCFATAFGAEGCALLAMLAEIPNKAFVFNLETGYQFPETLELREKILRQYGIEVKYVAAEETTASMEARMGGPIYADDPDLCCHIRKIVPLRRALLGYDAWISAIRRDQSPSRANAPIVSWDAKFGLVKVNPLANWTKKDVWNFILENDVPYNPLHNRGYPSIGCWPCTRPVAGEGSERDGRWAGTAKTECGLHI